VTRHWLAILALNAVIALGLRAIVAPQPIYSDRETYEQIGQRGFAPDCKADIFCYRVLVPVLLERVPLPSEQRWRAQEALSVILAGFVLAVATGRVLAGRLAPALATILAQTSFGLTYTAYDPYTVDAVVYLIASLFALAWFADWPVLAALVGMVGVFVKQTAVLLAATPALAALIMSHAPRRAAWIRQGLLAALVFGSFALGMDRFAGWSLASHSPSADFLGGGWLIVWLRQEGWYLGSFYVFAPFACAWLYAVLGWRWAPPRLRALGLAAIPTMLALVYVQTTERALGTYFFAVVPLATACLVRLPTPVALAAALTNGLFTAKVGLSSPWLPSSALLLMPAAVVCAYVLWIDLGLAEVLAARRTRRQPAE